MSKLPYTDFIDTLKSCSDDSSKNDVHEYMIDSGERVINFDGFSSKFLDKLYNVKDEIHTVDAICRIDGELFLIEFKNGQINKSKNTKTQISSKISNSLLLLQINENKNFVKNSSFILCYNLEKNPRRESFDLTKMQEKLNELGKIDIKEAPRFSLAKFESLYFNKVYTLTSKELSEFIEGKIFSCII